MDEHAIARGDASAPRLSELEPTEDARRDAHVREEGVEELGHHAPAVLSDDRESGSDGRTWWWDGAIRMLDFERDLRMRIFVLGASGYIGGAVASALVARGHVVDGLARSDDAARKVRSTGARVVRGGLEDVDAWSRTAAEADAIVHAASALGGDADAAVVDALLAAARGRCFVLTSAAPCAPASRTPVDEERAAPEGGPLDWLARLERVVAGSTSVRGLVVRVPMAYGDDGGPVARLVMGARAEGVARIIAPGDGRWSVVHVRDLARAYAMLIESPDARGIFHAADEAPLGLAEIMAAVGRAARVPVTTWTLAEAEAAYGPLAHLLARDTAIASTKLRSLGWRTPVGDALGGLAGAV